jgi:hypothetical protein
MECFAKLKDHVAFLLLISIIIHIILKLLLSTYFRSVHGAILPNTNIVLHNNRHSSHTSITIISDDIIVAY